MRATYLAIFILVPLVHGTAQLPQSTASNIALSNFAWEYVSGLVQPHAPTPDSPTSSYNDDCHSEVVALPGVAGWGHTLNYTSWTQASACAAKGVWQGQYRYVPPDIHEYQFVSVAESSGQIDLTSQATLVQGHCATGATGEMGFEDSLGSSAPATTEVNFRTSLVPVLGWSIGVNLYFVSLGLSGTWNTVVGTGSVPGMSKGGYILPRRGLGLSTYSFQLTGAGRVEMFTGGYCEGYVTMSNTHGITILLTDQGTYVGG